MSHPIASYMLSPHIAPLAVQDGQLVYIGPRRKKVAIFGGRGWRTMPWDNPDWENWSLNNFWPGPQHTDRRPSCDSQGRLAASRWWEQHNLYPDRFGPERGRIIQDEYDMKWVRSCPVPIYTTQPCPENPRVIVWPIDDFAKRYRDYFPCSFCMMIAQAIDEGFEELAVHGLALLLGTKRECTVEAAGVAYWLGLAEGRGMKITIPRDDFCLKHFARYGHEYWKERRAVEEYIASFDDRPVAV